MKQCLLHYRRDTTRLLVTHALYYMKYMDYIYLLDKGRVALEGGYEELKKTAKFQEIYEQFTKGHEKGGDSDEEEEEQRLKQEKFSHVAMGSAVFNKDLNAQSVASLSTSSALSQQNLKSSDQALQPSNSKYDNLILEEDRKRGEVAWSVFRSYFSLQGGLYFFIPFFIAISTQNTLDLW